MLNLNLFPIIEASEMACQKPGRQIGHVMLQLASETGEMCDWINRPWRQKEPFAGECADVINCVVDALWLHHREEYAHLGDAEYREVIAQKLNYFITRKTTKWKEAIRADV
ncbi:hypothetical protein PKO111_127 [Klebsiella phage PKO111]|uniref:Uncharacterized protein n=1 Tax=Klebsiella phage PKO111 TaxID=1654928 RepID=A0A162E4B6_9CAUD|nr:MazG-like pyrophosphatase [Klebsiella phage PKO111]AKJ73191.1 hypothetical protein PKO111_127 [Klebsiella phage PKO111]